jgi:hypothetical protein
VSYKSAGIVTVTVASASATPTGNVSLSVDGGTPITQPLDGSGSSTFTISGLTAGNHNLTATYAAQDVFAASSNTGTLTVTPATLTVTAATADKIYDGTAAASVSLADNHLGTDVVTLSYASATFDTKNVGTGKTVTVTGITIGGADGGNYSLQTTTATATANVTPRDLSVTAAGVTKAYDGTTKATVVLADNRVSGDALTDSYTTAKFPDANVGTGKPVAVSGITISGADLGNYHLLNTTAATTASITPRVLIVTAKSPNKVYDGTTATTVTLSDNRVGGDALTVSYADSEFADKNVGTGKTVNVTGIAITGAGAGNYSLPSTTVTATATITRRSLTVSATASDKVYDRTNAATVALTDNRLAGDMLTAVYNAATFNNKNVGTGKTVTVSGISLTGPDGGNYAVNGSATTTANVTPRGLTVTATGVDKTYDGTTTATVTLSDNAITGDAVNDSYASASFTDKNVQGGKAVSVTGIAISGGDAGNYNLLNPAATATASITPRSLTVTATRVNKVYDGTTAATVILSDSRVSGDVFTDSYADAEFADKNVANGKTVTVTGISISGVDAFNYALVGTTAATTANITRLPLIVSAAATDKVYDRTTTATVTLTDTRLSGDVFTDSYNAATFNNKNVGAGKTVTVTGISISGPDAGNYSVNGSTTTTANVTPRNLTVTAAGVDKTYNGTTTATVTLSDNRVSGDAVADSYASAISGDKNVGLGKAVTVSGIAIGGADAGNYNLLNTTAFTTANITPRNLAVTATHINKVYDGTTAATVTLSDNRVSGDALGDSYADAEFADKNAGTGKTVTVTGIAISGADAANYTANTTATTTASITPAVLTVTANDATRPEGDANPTFTVSYTGFVGLETLATSGVTGSPSVSSGATSTTKPGTYASGANCIKPTAGTLAAANYTFTFVNGTLTVTNLNPAVTAPADQTAAAGVAKSFALGSFTDPGTTDNPWAVDVSWGDGPADTTFNMSVQGVLTAKSHKYAAPGTYKVTVTVTDNFGGSSFATFMVTVN